MSVKKRGERGDTWRKKLIASKFMYQMNMNKTRMRRARVECGLSQACLARQIGVSAATIGDIEHGLTPVRGERGIEIAKLLNVKFEKLFHNSPKIGKYLVNTEK